MLQAPGRGAPVTLLFAGGPNVSKRKGFQILFGFGNLGGELGVALDRAGDGTGCAADELSGFPPTAAEGQEADDLFAFLLVENGTDWLVLFLQFQPWSWSG